MKQIDYGQGSISKAMLRSAGPMMAAQIFSLLYNIIDRMYIARMPEAGHLAIGGIGLCFPILTILTAFANLYGSGGAPLSAICQGRKEEKEASLLQGASFGLILITGLILMAIGLLFTDPLLYLFGATPGSLQYASPYLRIVMLGSVFSMIATGMNPFLSAQGLPTAGMCTVAAGALLNIVLDPLFIFSLGWGIEGAAVATVLSQIVSSLFVLYFLCRKQAPLPLKIGTIRHSLRLKRIRRIVSLGFAGFIMQVTNSIVQSASNQQLGVLGGDLYISVMTIVSSVRQILDTPIFGLADGSGPIISYNYGAGKFDRVKSAILRMTGICLLYTAIIWAMILICPGAFIALFNDDPSLEALAIPALNIYFFAFLFQAFQYSGQTVFKSLNMRRQAVFFSLFRKVILVLPLIYLLGSQYGPTGVFLAEPISNFVGGTLCFLTMYVQVYRKLGNRDRKQSTN